MADGALTAKELYMSAGFRRFSRFLGIVSSAAAGLVTLLLCVYIMARFVRLPFPGAMEFSRLLMCMIVFGGMAHCQAMGKNIQLEFLFNRFPAKMQYWIHLIALCLGVVMWAFVVWRTSIEGLNALRIHEIEYPPGLIYFPTWPSKTMIALGSLVLWAEILFQLIEHALRKRG